MMHFKERGCTHLVNDHMKEKFLSLFGNSNDDIFEFFAPGRVNLIGEHIDYNGGFVLPCAIHFGNSVFIRKNGTNTIRLAADDLDGVFVSCEINNLDSMRGKEWGSYQLGVIYELLQSGCDISGVDMLFYSNLPFGAGLSSSASIEVCTAFAVMSLFEHKIDLVELSVLSQRAENNFVGVNCGIMDQFSCALGKKDHAVLIKCDDLSFEYVPFVIDGYSIIIGNTNKKRSLSDSKYNERRAECDEALETLRANNHEISSLCELSLAEFEKIGTVIKNKTVYNRALHAVSENDRVLKSIKLLSEGKIHEFGKLLNASHASLRELYDVTGLELDTMAELSQRQPSCLGSRMTGAGFGGCTVSIVKNDGIDSFIENVSNAYTEKTGLIPEFYVTSPCGGVKKLKF